MPSSRAVLVRQRPVSPGIRASVMMRSIFCRARTSRAIDTRRAVLTRSSSVVRARERRSSIDGSSSTTSTCFETMAFHPTGLTLLHQQAACQIVRGAFTLPYRDLAAARSIREPSAATLACPRQALAAFGCQAMPDGSSVRAAALLAGLGGLEEEQQLATRLVAIDFTGDVALEH